jgi:hypothetical protein
MIREGAEVTTFRRPTQGPLARCTVDDVVVLMSAEFIDDTSSPTFATPRPSRNIGELDPAR